MEILSDLLALSEGNPSQKRPVMQSFNIFFFVSLNKILNKQSSCQFLEAMIFKHHNCNDLEQSQGRRAFQADPYPNDCH